MRIHTFLLLSACLLIATGSRSFGQATRDTASRRQPRHYFHYNFYADTYGSGERMLDTANPVMARLGSYQVSQLNLGFSLPVVTKDFYNKDSTRISNIHFLLNGSWSGMTVNFKNIDDHTLVRSALGFRTMYNNGKKSIFYLEFSPFSTVDAGFPETRKYRTATTFLYDWAASPGFSLRVGYTRSFIWGKKYSLPYIGMRVGKLDKLNFSLQFPRSASLNVPIGRYIRTSLYTRPRGGLFTFSDTDSLLIDSTSKSSTIYFGRYEFLSGLRVDILPASWCSMFVSTGFTTKNFIGFAPEERKIKGVTRDGIDNSIFVNFGLVLRLGRTKSIYNNRQVYDMIDLDNSTGHDGGAEPGNGEIPVAPKKMPRSTADEVIDLIDNQDIY